MAKIVTVNRAPVLTLWGTVVAERLGFDRQAALSLGRCLSGLNAQSKGQLDLELIRADAPEGDYLKGAWARVL